MKKNFKSTAVVSLALLALSMGACNKDEFTGPSPKGNLVTLELRTNPMSKVNAGSRAGETDETVANLAVFGVDTDGKVAQTFEIMQPTTGSLALPSVTVRQHSIHLNHQTINQTEN